MLLKDCIEIKNGKDYSHLPKGDVPVYGTGGIFKYVNKYLYDNSALLLPRKGSLNNVIYVEKQKFWTVDTIFYAISKNNNVNLKYLYYYLTLVDINKLDMGSTIPSMTSSLYYQLDIPTPKREIQDKIVNILSNIDNQIERNNTMTKRLQVLGNTIYSKEINKDTKYFDLKTVANISTGKEDANFASPNGKYNFYTCSEEISKCDKFAFAGNSILIAGNGNFNVKYYNGKFNAYQRTYVIQNDTLFGNIYYSSLRSVDGFTKNANGSIIKFITLGLVQSIQIPILSDKINNLLNDVVSQKNKIILETEKLINLKEKLLPLLINGQLNI